MAARTRLAPTGSRLLLGVWMGVGALAWALHRPIDWLRSREVLPPLVPGALVIATRSDEVAKLVRELLSSMEVSGRFFRPRRVVELGVPAAAPPRRTARTKKTSSKSTPSDTNSVGSFSWNVTVRHGLEQAFLRQIRYHLARQLAHANGYERLDWRMALFLVEQVVAANQARKVKVASPAGNGPVSLTKQHQEYKKWLCTGPDPTHPVEVAILDSAVDRSQLPARLRRRVHNYDEEDVEFLGHGAAMAAIVADVAPSANITIYPIFGLGEDDATEFAISGRLTTLCRSPEPPDVVLMSFEFTKLPGSRKAKFARTAIEDQLPPQLTTSSIAASGNGGADAAIPPPAVCRGVMAVGAIGKNLTRAPYSCYRIPSGAVGPRTFAVAPGGVEKSGNDADHAVTVNDEGVVGTSVAAAYAAGVVARVLGQVERERRTDYESVFELIKDNADTSLGGGVADDVGIGMVRQLRPL